jgi:hypothetical protein
MGLRRCRRHVKMPKKPNAKATSSTSRIPPVLTGVAGEYFVAAELSRRGYIASISLRNTRGIDILATNQAASRSVTIQCKTNLSGEKHWMLNENSERFFAPDHYYVFVALGSGGCRPGFTLCRAVSSPSSLEILTVIGSRRWAEAEDST